MSESNTPNLQEENRGPQEPQQPPYSPVPGPPPCPGDPANGPQTPPPYQAPYQPYGQPPYQPYGQNPPPFQKPPRAPSSPETVRLYNILSYFSFLWIVGLIADHHNPKVRFHVNQGILLSILELVLGIAVGIVSSLLTSIFSVGFGPMLVFSQLGATVVGLLKLAQFGIIAALIIIGVMHAVQDKEEPLPVIGTLFTVVK